MILLAKYKFEFRSSETREPHQSAFADHLWHCGLPGEEADADTPPQVPSQATMVSRSSYFCASVQRLAEAHLGRNPLRWIALCRFVVKPPKPCLAPPALIRSTIAARDHIYFTFPAKVNNLYANVVTLWAESIDSSNMVASFVCNLALNLWMCAVILLRHEDLTFILCM